MNLSVVVPVYNGERTIPLLYERVIQILDGKFTWEILFVFDSGKDNSWTVINKLVKSNPDNVRGFRLQRNYGQHNAILFGIREAIGDYVVTLDEDMQHDPVLIYDLIKKQKDGNYDVVYATFKKLKYPGLRIMTSEWLRKILKKIIPGLFPGYSSFRLIKSETAKKIINLKSSYTFIDGYLGLVTDNFGYIDAEHYRRADGISSYTYMKLFKHFLMIAIAYSPLKRWILILALIFNSLSIVLYFIFIYFTNSGLIKLPVILTGIFGLILLISGLIAETIHYRGIKTNKIPVSVI